MKLAFVSSFRDLLSSLVLGTFLLLCWNSTIEAVYRSEALFEAENSRGLRAHYCHGESMMGGEGHGTRTVASSSHPDLNS